MPSKILRIYSLASISTKDSIATSKCSNSLSQAPRVSLKSILLFTLFPFCSLKEKNLSKSNFISKLVPNFKYKNLFWLFAIPYSLQGDILHWHAESFVFTQQFTLLKNVFFLPMIRSFDCIGKYLFLYHT